ncbi:type VI secretion system-associated protein TagF [Tateyamaria armeniaca]|uniref:Type VI secretion system-associated protein TagF n=1 Tax=Tateyamaria armeniaca TaxID=2518930 RepID=A0ABW8V2T4_9RHOB
MSVVLYGKHPGFGDFLSWGMERDVRSRLEAWVQDVMPGARDLLGAHWDTVWDTAPDLRFWIGPDVLGVPLCGVWRASSDKVGRRYPLMLGLTGSVTPPPVHTSHDASPYVALAAHLDQIEDQTAGQGGVEGLVTGYDAPPAAGTPYDAEQAGMLWGMRGDDDLARLFADAAEADAYCAQYGRSHWWHEGSPCGRPGGCR